MRSFLTDKTTIPPVAVPGMTDGRTRTHMHVHGDMTAGTVYRVPSARDSDP